MRNAEMNGNGLSRRGFLGGAFSVGLVGLGGCAGFRPFGKLRKDESLVAVLSDCHVGDWHSPEYQRVKFVNCLSRVLALDPLPGKMLICGDLAYLWGRKEDYALSRRLLQPVLDAGIELTIGMGNHDRRDNFLECWPEYAKRTQVPNRIVSVAKGVNFDYVMLDTLNQPEDPTTWITPGALDDEQREWLRATCRQAKRPLLVFGHHPADELGEVGHGRTYKSACKFGEILMGKKDAPTRCCGYIHGHDHHWQLTRSLIHWSDSRIGITASLPSTGHWGDIGYSLLREHPDRAVLTLVQYDFFTPKPLNPDEPPNPSWKALVRDNEGACCTFMVPCSRMGTEPMVTGSVPSAGRHQRLS